jgi:hypothetical protein
MKRENAAEVKSRVYATHNFPLNFHLLLSGGVKGILGTQGERASQITLTRRRPAMETRGEIPKEKILLH